MQMEVAGASSHAQMPQLPPSGLASAAGGADLGVGDLVGQFGVEAFPATRRMRLTAGRVS